jgi:MFS family permease
MRENHNNRKFISNANKEEAAYRKVMVRIVPLMFLCYAISYLDRVNIAFAKLQMLGDLHISETNYAIAAGAFFWGYILFEIPSNLISYRVGPRRWIARIMVSWGLVSSLLIFIEPISNLFHISKPLTFYTLRFLLGVCEAGFFPAITLYIQNWFPASRQSRVFGWLFLALPLSLAFGSVLSGGVMEFADHAFGMRGWRWMVLLEGVPSIVLGLIVLVVLKETVNEAKWLDEGEKGYILSGLARDEGTHRKHNIKAAFLDWRVWMLMGVLFTLDTGFYGLAFWMPTLIHDSGVTKPFYVGLLTFIPFAVGGVAMVWNGAWAHQTGRWRTHMAIPAFLGGVGLMLSAYFSTSVGLSVLFLSIGTAGVISIPPVFWSLPGRFLSGAAAAAGLAFINSMGNFAGFAGSFITNEARIVTGNAANGTYALGLTLWICCVICILLPRTIFQQGQSGSANSDTSVMGGAASERAVTQGPKA